MVSLKTVVVAGIQYLIHPQKLGAITATINPDSILPVTLLTTEEIFGGDLEQILDSLAQIDDVFIPDFGGVLVEKVPENGTFARRDRDASALMGRALHQLDTSIEITNELDYLPSGPYILHGPNLYQAWRLYDDEYEAFSFGVIPEDVTAPDEFRALNALSPGGVFKSIPVPSRLYHRKPSAKKPLSGVRISITDAISLRGTRSTLSSRAWTAMHPEPAASSADYVNRLLDLGAVIVGKTKVSQLLAGGEWVDASAPWNPRADQYQDPSASSAGAAVAAAGYSWLQHAIGEDSIGGLLSPGAAQGVYTLRPTVRQEGSLDGVQAGSSRYDTLGFASASMSKLASVSKAILNETGTLEPEKIVYLDDLLDLPQEQSDFVERFIGFLENSTNAAVQRIGLSDAWDQNAPSDAGGKSLTEYLDQAIFRSFCYDYAQSYQEFREAYRQEYGSEPFAEATTQFRWDLGSNTTEDEYAGDLDRIKTFQGWAAENIIPDSKTLLVLPYAISRPIYRQDENIPPETVLGVTPELLGPALGLPHLIVPFGQVPYNSKVSGKEEYLPFSVSIIGPAGSDVAMIESVREALEAGRRAVEVETGKYAFPLADGL